MAMFAFALLIAALVLFFISTNQWALWIRGVIWGGGLLLLFIAGILVVFDHEHGGGLFQALGDLAAHIDAPERSVVAQYLERNVPNVGRFVLPLLDLYLILGLILGIVAIIAFSPGEALERALRPAMVGLVGAILGGILALGIVGTGFGVPPQDTYAAVINRSDVADGDTLWIDNVSVRLRGVDAPEIGQICRVGNQRQDCGLAARRHLQDIVSGARVTCVPVRTNRQNEGRYRRTDEAFRRALVTCTAERGGELEFDVGQRMIADGYAIERRGVPGDYRRDVELARRANAGLWAACTLRPDVWVRIDEAARNRFSSRGAYPRNDVTLTMGRCPLPRRPAPGPAPTYAPPDADG